MKVSLSILLILNLLVPGALAWNGVGHRAVAQLVWRQMAPAERQAASELLKHHPHYQLILTADLPPGVDVNEWAFLTAAAWPDLVRPAKPGQPHKPESVTKYNQYPHGLELPFLLAGETNRALLDNFPVDKRVAPLGLSNAFVVLKDPKASAHDRAVSLCWVLHLGADLHQPLHVGTLVTQGKPRGYAAGGDLLVLARNGDRVSMHTFWDQLPGVDQSYRGVTAFADELAAAPELKPRALKELRKHKTIDSWVQESFEVAATFSYAAGRVQFVDAADLKSGKLAASEIPMLKEDYEREARQIACRRLALAVHRIRSGLKGAWQGPLASAQ